MSVEYCTKSDGVSLKAYDMMRKISVAMWYGAKAAELTFKILGKALFFVMPSGAALQIYDGSVIPDFRLVNLKFWAIRIKLGDESIGVPLPKNMKNWWEAFIAPVNYQVPNSQNWYYVDPVDNIAKLGTTFTPNKTYGIFTEGLYDVSEITVIILVIWMIHKMGLGKWAQETASHLWSLYWDRRYWHVIDETLNNTQSILEKLTQIDYLSSDFAAELQSILSTTGDHTDRLDAIEAKIGLRLIMR